MKRETIFLRLAVIILGLPIVGFLAFLTYDLITVPKKRASHYLFQWCSCSTCQRFRISLPCFKQ